MRGRGLCGVALVAGLLACASASPRVDGARALRRVERQCAAGPRVPGTAAHDQVARWLEAELQGLGARVERQEFTDSTLGRPLRLVNLIARYAPQRSPRILFCAHWDSRPTADQDPDAARRGQPVPGANDGGSGVAVLLEVAEALHRRPPPVGVDLVFFDGEDMGDPDRPEQFCLGSRYYARTLVEPKPRAGFLLDMVGDRNLDIHPERNSVEHAANLVELVLQGARATGARGFRIAPRYTLFDDHMRLIAAGVPTVDIIDFDYPAWHTTSDTPDKLAAGSLAEVGRVVLWLVYRSPLSRLGGAGS